MCCRDIFEPDRAPEAQPGLPLPLTDMPLTTPVRKAPCPGSFPISCASCILPVPQSNWFHHYASQQNYSNKSHPPETKKGTPHPCYYKAYLPQPFLPHCISKCNLCVALHSMWCPLPTGCAYMWLINYWQSHLPNGGCPVFSQLMLFRLLEPSCISGMNRNDQNRNKVIYARATIECL